MTYVQYANAKIGEFIWEGIKETAEEYPNLARIEIVGMSILHLLRVPVVSLLSFAEELVSLPWEGKVVNVLKYGTVFIFSPLIALGYSIYTLVMGLWDPISHADNVTKGLANDLEKINDIISLRSSSFSKELADAYCSDEGITDENEKELIFNEYEKLRQEKLKAYGEQKEKFHTVAFYVESLKNSSGLVDSALEISRQAQ